MNIIKLLESLYGTTCHGVREAPISMVGAFFILTNSLTPKDIKSSISLNTEYFDNVASLWGASRSGNVVSIWFYLKIGASGFDQKGIIFSNMPNSFTPCYLIVSDANVPTNVGVAVVWGTELSVSLPTSMLEQWDYLIGSVTYITSE